MLKILQARLQQHVNHELPDVQAGFRKSRGTRDQIANIHWIIGKAREIQKISTSALLTTPKPLTVWITTNCGKFLMRWEYQTTLPVSWETCRQDRKQWLELGMVQNMVFCFIDYTKAFHCVDHNKLWKILKDVGIPDHLTCLLRNLYAGEEATVRTGHGTTDWF